MIQRDEIWKAIEPLVRRVSRSTALTIVGGGGSGIELHHDGSVAFYANSDAGLAEAIGDAVSGDQIFLPPGPNGGAYTASTSIPDGLTVTGISRTATVISGMVTLGVGSTIESLSVIRSADSIGALIGVNGPQSGTAKVINCELRCTQDGSGNAMGLQIGAEGSVIVWNSHLEGTSVGGDGYGGGISGGIGGLVHYGGEAIGSTTPYLEPAEESA